MGQIIRKYGLPQIAAWTLTIAFMLAITLYVHHQDTLKEALLEARNYYRLNFHYRAWNAEIGGLYAPIEKILPNPYLNIPGRDIITVDQKKLTLVNPAYMSRMVFDQVKADSAMPIICKLTSLKPMNPVNTPDAWEREALVNFAKAGSTERFQVIPLNGAPYLRLISRFVIEQSCLKCHEGQGYKLGDIRGGISISVPLAPYFQAESKTRNTIAVGYLLLWLSGSGALALFSGKRHEQENALAAEAVERQAVQEHLEEQAVLLEDEISERRRAEDELRKSEGRYRMLLESVTDYIYTTVVENESAVATSHGPGCAAVTGYTAQEYDDDPGLWLRMVPEEERQEVREQAERVLAGKWIAPLEHRIVHKHGEIRWIRNTSVPHYDMEGRLIAYDGIVSDITVRRRSEEVVKKWKSTLESAQRIAHLGSWELNLEKNELIWSDEIYRIFGLLPQEFSVTYEGFLSMAHPDDRDYVNDAYSRSVENDIPYDVFYRIIRKSDQKIRYVHEICEHTRDKSGGVIRSLGTIHDVTEQKLAGQSLAERVKLSELSAEIGCILTMPGDLRNMLSGCARSIVNNLDAAFARIWTLNAPENILELQASAGLYTSIDGTHSRVPIGKLKIGRIAEERKPLITNAVIGDPLVNDQEWAKREGMVAFAGHPLTVENRLIGVIALFSRNQLTDVSLKALASISNEIAVGIERKRAEDALMKEKEFLNNLLHGSAIATFVLDPQHRVLLWNQACEELTGMKAADVIGTSLHWQAFYSVERPCLVDIVIDGRTDQLHHLYEHASRSALTPEGLQAEGHYSDLNGQARYIMFYAAPIRNGDGSLLGAIETLQDITEQKNLEAQLFQSQKMEAIGQLAGGIAHDFNNILTAIVGFSTLIEMHMAKNDPQRANLSNVLAAADRAADLTRSLLTFSRKQAINPRAVDLNRIISKIGSFLKRIIGEEIELNTTCTPGELTVNADSGQIEQVLMNLAANARDAMPGKGALSIDTGTVELDEDFIMAQGYGEAGWYAWISVTDSGQGMDEATCKKIFEPFFTTKEVGKGTGLGLSIVFGIVKQHNGFITVYSQPGIGTTFRILLPLIQSVVSECQSCEDEVIGKGTETILVVDDDASLRDLAEKTLEMFGYTVITAVDGRDALDRFKQNSGSIDLVILDIIMPEMNGKEAFDEMKTINPDLKAIFISGYTSDIIRKRGLMDQGLEFVAKPLNLKQLLIKVRDVLGEEA